MENAIFTTDRRERIDHAIEILRAMSRAHAHAEDGLVLRHGGIADDADLEAAVEQLATRAVEEPVVPDEGGHDRRYLLGDDPPGLAEAAGEAARVLPERDAM